VAAAAAVLALPRSAGAAESSPVGFGAGTTGGGSATAVTVWTPDAFKTAVTGNTAKVGFYDNYVVGAETACHSRMGARMLVENNAFRSAKVAVTTSRDSDEDGYANPTGNDLGGAATEISRVGTFTEPPYGYTAEPASSAVAPVTSGAGAGKL
jgi:pectate lyase